MTTDAAIDEIATFLGERITRSKSDRAIHGQSETWFAPCPPDAVAYPETTNEVARIVAACVRHGCPVIPWGTGTSLEGHSLPIRGGITVDFARMNKVLAIHHEDLDVVVQPGITREALNAELRATGLFFPVDPGANAAIGGMAATRASGTTAVRYGTMRDNVLALEVVTGEGQVMRTGSRAAKSSAGYDLTGLMVGSEGTLGLITELTLRLHPQPEAVAAATCAFADFGAAVDAVIETIQTGLSIARIEFVDDDMARGFNLADGAGLPEVPHLFVEFHGSAAGVAEEVERFGAIAADHGGTGFKWAGQQEDRNRLWKMRHNAAYAVQALRPGCRIFVTDLCVPISCLAEAVAETRADIRESGLIGPLVGHVGDGNVHAVILLEPDNAGELARAKDLAERMSERALRLGGTVTGEHGIGMGKLGFMQAEHGHGWAVMGAIKRALDPAGILNPGKVVRQNSGVPRGA